MAATQVFTYIWEYNVKEEFLDAFEHAYGPNGEWIQFFKKGIGYISTELHKDVSAPLHFVTIDYWVSKEARDIFQMQFQDEFAALDDRCEAFTESEKLIGDFDCFTKKEI